MACQKCVCGSYTRLTVESKSRIWPSFGCCRSHKRGLPCGRLWFHGSSDPVLYAPTILDMWVQVLFDTKAHIPPAVELKVAYMAKFWVPSFPQTRASLWHIMILWQFGAVLYVPAILGLCVKGLFGIHSSYTPLLWNEKSRLLRSVWCPRSHNRGHPCDRLCFYGSLDPKLYKPDILGPWVQGLCGT